MADPENVWNLPIKLLYHVGNVGSACFRTYERHFALTIRAQGKEKGKVCLYQGQLHTFFNDVNRNCAQSCIVTFSAQLIITNQS